jgi:hypothetical protein
MSHEYKSRLGGPRLIMNGVRVTRTSGGCFSELLVRFGVMFEVSGAVCSLDARGLGNDLRALFQWSSNRACPGLQNDMCPNIKGPRTVPSRKRYKPSNQV